MYNVQCAIFFIPVHCTLIIVHYIYRLPPPQPHPPPQENHHQPPQPNQLDQLPPHELLGAITLDLILLVIDAKVYALSVDQL